MRLLPLLLFITSIASAQLAFQEVASSSGVGVSYGFSDLGGGVSFVDFDRDGWDDITFATTGQKKLYFFKNQGGTFKEIDLGINHFFEAKQVLWVDYDNDDDMDLFVTSKSGTNRLYRNQGGLSFTDVTLSSGLFTADLPTFGASFGDIDNDGDLDLFINNRDITEKKERNYLYKNNGGVFEEITEAAGIHLGYEPSFCAAFFDYDNDGFQDIYVANDRYNNINRLYRNRGDLTFEDVSEASGAGIAIDAMSTTVEDFDADGWPDIYVTNTEGGNHFLHNNGDGTFSDIAQATGTGFFSVAWGSVFLDADNDGDLDLYVSGELEGLDERLPSAFYRNNGGTFMIPPGIGLDSDNRISFSNAIGDVNNDGRPDIIVMNHVSDNFLWKNTTQNDNQWLRVKLRGSTSNRDGIGARIEIAADGQTQYRHVLCGEGYLGQNSLTESFGLGAASKVDLVKVRWPGGDEELVTDISANQTITIAQGKGLLPSGWVSPESVAIRIYPNPTFNGLFRIEAPQEIKSVTILDAVGRTLKTGQSPENSLLGFSEGIYFVNVQFENFSATKMVVYNRSFR